MPLTQQRFEKLLVNAVVAANWSFASVELPEVRELLTAGKQRRQLRVLGRKTVSKRGERQRLIAFRALSSLISLVLVGMMTIDVREKVVELIKGARSRVSITFDLWTDLLARGYVCVTGHFFDAQLRLCAPLLFMKHLPKTTGGASGDVALNAAAAGHTAGRIADEIRAGLDGLVPEEKLFCSVTDGARNVVGAARLLTPEGARSCVQHGLQLILKKVSERGLSIDVSFSLL